jgi:hypothetical protein
MLFTQPSAYLPFNSPTLLHIIILLYICIIIAALRVPARREVSGRRGALLPRALQAERGQTLCVCVCVCVFIYIYIYICIVICNMNKVDRLQPVI